MGSAGRLPGRKGEDRRARVAQDEIVTGSRNPRH